MIKKIGESENKISEVSGLETSTALNTKIGEVENKIPDSNGLEATAILNTKIGKTEDKHLMLWLSQEHRFTNSDNNKLPSEIVDA